MGFILRRAFGVAASGLLGAACVHALRTHQPELALAAGVAFVASALYAGITGPAP